MGRAPCCEKMGLKRGPWTTEEDNILVNFINQNGHDNWRALPKRAGLMRCGKSCRLRWMNYLKPDIKRGNFTTQEEETIIRLHQELGNKWSVIAAKLPGRTDNEIKNVWHTNLKKRLDKKSRPANLQARIEEPEPLDFTQDIDTHKSPAPSSSSEISSLTTAVDTFGEWPEVDQSFWSEVFSVDGSSEFSTSTSHSFPMECMFGSNLDMGESVNIWNDPCFEVEELIVLPQIW